ncbi:MAG: tRNA-dependent cyclodipeptide synthase [Sediminibacterium sp.]
MEKNITFRVVKLRSAPKITIQQLSKYRKCYLGVSVNNPFFRDKHLGLLLRWIANHFDECIIIIGDYLHRINETILLGKFGDDAINASMLRGNQLHEIIEVALSLLPQNKFKIYRWKDFLDEHPTVYDKKKQLLNYYNESDEFKNAIIQSSTEFIERLSERGEVIYLSKEDAVAQSKEYLIEEMAVFSKLIEEGYKVQVYPGTQLNILKELANKKYKSVDTNLKEGIYIDLTVKKRK